MAGFTTLAVLSLAGMAVSAWGQHKAGVASKKAGEAAQSASNDAADLSDYNAKVAELQAEDAVQRGAEEEQRFRAGVRGIIGGQRAGFAGANIDVSFGSAADVQADAAFLGELDALTIRTNAAREAWGMSVQAEDLRRRAAIQRKEGGAQAAAGAANATAANIGAVGTLLTGGAGMLQARYGSGRR